MVEGACPTPDGSFVNGADGAAHGITAAAADKIVNVIDPDGKHIWVRYNMSRYVWVVLTWLRCLGVLHVVDCVWQCSDTLTSCLFSPCVSRLMSQTARPPAITLQPNEGKI